MTDTNDVLDIPESSSVIGEMLKEEPQSPYELQETTTADESAEKTPEPELAPEPETTIEIPTAGEERGATTLNEIEPVVAQVQPEISGVETEPNLEVAPTVNENLPLFPDYTPYENKLAHQEEEVMIMTANAKAALEATTNLHEYYQYVSPLIEKLVKSSESGEIGEEEIKALKKAIEVHGKVSEIVDNTYKSIGSNQVGYKITELAKEAGYTPEEKEHIKRLVGENQQLATTMAQLPAEDLKVIWDKRIDTFRESKKTVEEKQSDALEKKMAEMEARHKSEMAALEARLSKKVEAPATTTTTSTKSKPPASKGKGTATPNDTDTAYDIISPFYP